MRPKGATGRAGDPSSSFGLRRGWLSDLAKEQDQNTFTRRRGSVGVKNRNQYPGARRNIVSEYRGIRVSG